MTWKRTKFSAALLPLGVAGTNVPAGIVLILWVWLPGTLCGCGFPSRVGVASCTSVLSPLSYSRWYALMEIQLFTAVVLRMFDMELMDPIPTVVSSLSMLFCLNSFPPRPLPDFALTTVSLVAMGVPSPHTFAITHWSRPLPPLSVSALWYQMFTT